MSKIHRLIWISIFLMTIFFGTIIVLLSVESQKGKAVERECTIISNGVYEAVQNELSKPMHTSLAMANDIFLVDMLHKEDSYPEGNAVDLMADYLSSLRDATGAETAFLVSEKTKRYYSYDGLNKVIDVDNDSHDVWYSIFINKKKAFDVDVDTDQVNGDSWTAFVNARIQDQDGQLLGVCGLGVPINKLQEVIQQYERDYGVAIDFVDPQGNLQVSTKDVNIQNSFLYDAQDGKEKDGYAYWSEDGEYIEMRYIDSLEWYLVVHGLKKQLTAEDRGPVFLGAIIIILINLVSTWIMTRNNN